MGQDTSDALGASFRDPAGRMYHRDGLLLRQVNSGHESGYRALMNSGLYQTLVRRQLLIPHREVDLALAQNTSAALVLQPEPVPWISYPWEWSFSQLRHAALATLEIQRLALDYGLALKDASAFNIQFHRGRPIFIDTLSFAGYEEGQPWVAYRQFCQHFLAPLALISYRDYRLLKLTRNYIDGIPLELASRLLPRRTWLRYSLLAHIHLHARAQQRFADRAEAPARRRQVSVSLPGMKAMIAGLVAAVRRLHWRAGASEWGDYYSDTNYRAGAMAAKLQLVDAFISQAGGSGILLDLGSNTGRFSRLGLAHGFDVVAMDIDELAVERAYCESARDGSENFLPLVQDLTNPTPALGWAHRERMSLAGRGPARVLMALALIHHLAISNNVPLADCARYFSELGEFLIIEFVPRSDSQVRRLLATREDVFPGYSQAGFEAAFAEYFELLRVETVTGSERGLYLMRRRG